jgi:phosphohistidine phosphatase
VDLFILRHGKAEQSGAPGDAERRLTAKGRDEITEIAEWMASGEFVFDVIATSPLARARETAEIVAAALLQKDRLAVWDALAPGGNPDVVCRAAGTYGDDARVLIVGHEPSLSALVSRIISGSENAGIVMAKGGLARIRNYHYQQHPSGELQWLLTPKLIRRIR